MKSKILLLAFLLATLTASAAWETPDFKVNGLSYIISTYDPSTVKVTYPSLNYDGNHTNYSGDIVIPETVTHNGNTYRVTVIGDFAFSGCTSLKSVTIPESITTINNYAFRGCTSLKSVQLPNSVTIINLAIFKNCYELTSVTLGNQVTSIGSGAFSECSKLSSIIIPNTVTSIGVSAFKKCSSLTSVTIPESVTSFGASAFENCTGLRTFVMEASSPDDITAPDDIFNNAKVGTYCNLFVPQGCTNNYSGKTPWSTFKSIKEPNIRFTTLVSTLEIGSEISIITVIEPSTLTDPIIWTSSNTSIATVKSAFANPNYGIVTALREGTVDITATCGTVSNSITIRVIPVSATAVNLNCSTLSLLIGETSTLSATVLPSNTTYPTVTWSSTKPSVATVDSNGQITAVSVGTTNIKATCGSVSATCVVTVNPVPAESIELSDTRITLVTGKSQTLTANVLPANTTNPTVSWYSSNTSIARVSNGMVSAISAGSTKIYAMCGDAQSICYVTVTPAWTTTGINYTKNSDNASYSVTGFTSSLPAAVVIPATYNNLPVTAIGNQAFMNCKTITSVVIPNSVTSIGDYAFNYCENLTSVMVSESVSYIGKGAFQRCAKLSSFTGEHTTTDHKCLIIDNTLYGFAPSGLTSYSIPNGVTAIAPHVFDGCKSIRSLTLPETVTSIGEGAFYACEALESFSVPSGVSEISDWTFWGCTELSSVTFNGNIISIGLSAFDGCNSLTSIVIPASVTSIGDYVFFGCSGLTSIEIPNSVTSIGNYVFSGCSGLTSIEIPNSVTSIGHDAFFGCSGLISVEIPNSVTSIGYAAFSMCSGLQSFYGKYTSEDHRCLIIEGVLNSFAPYDLISYTIPNTVTSIGNYAFSYCSGLTSVEIPNSVTSIGNYAFQNCSKLTSIKSGIIDPSNMNISSLGVFSGVPTSTCKLYVPRRTASLYRAKSPWNSFSNIEEYGFTGDANMDYAVTVADVSTTINYVLGTNTADFDVEAADINGNGKVTVADATLMTNIVLEQPSTASLSGAARAKSFAYDNSVVVTMTDVNIAEDMVGQVELANVNDIVAMQMEVTVPEGLKIDDVTTDDKHSASFKYLGASVYRVIVYSVDNSAFETDNVLSIKFEEDGYVESGSTIEVHNVLVNENNNGAINEYAVPGANAAVINTPTPTGTENVAAESGYKIFADGGELVVVAPNNGTIHITALSGMTITRCVKAGVNRIAIPKGMYILNGVKVII